MHEGIFGKKIATTRTLCFLNYKFLTKKIKLYNRILLDNGKKFEILINIDWLKKFPLINFMLG
jgi:hypothetical protein